MPNRLASEASPYLRQHADNPVDWYPWGEEAFARARAEDKPILLSVGYSSCHWCHVMAHESFEDPATAAVMNELFVNVKVDREERPDVDALYMEAVQAVTGHGGWPMTVFCTPDGRPFFGGTYFPKEARHGLPGFVDLCRAVDDAWRNRRDEVERQASELTASINRVALLAARPNDALPGPETIAAAETALLHQADRTWGGFGSAPKFPQCDALDLLLRAWQRAGPESPAAEVVTTTLDAMASGGIYDHVGGGFHRYAVDVFWMVPHFEKMLYDQAQLTRVYLHGWLLTGRPTWRQVVEETVAYVLRDLCHPEGGFFSAEDADSEGEEGRFYTWRIEELESLVSSETIAWYGATRAGNFEGRNILHRPVRGDLLRPPTVEADRQRLFEARCRRPRPGLDHKVLTEWNALFLGALAEAGAALARPDWLGAAEAAAEFLLARLRRPDGRLLRSWTEEGGARHLAYAADHAALIDALSRLYEATGRARWVEAARSTAEAMLDLFWDSERGGLFTAGHDAERLVTRPKDVLDNATPSANSLAAVALVRLAALTGEARYEDRAADILRLLADPVRRHPTAFTHLLYAAELLSDGVSEVVVAGDRPDLVRTVQTRWLPRAVLAWGERFASPLWAGRDDGAAYVCRRYACGTPAVNPEVLAGQLAG